jgi:UTP--glucose-1-phosphate uridylyltransferase
MLPILTKPLLQYGIQEAISCGIDTISIVTSRGKGAIEDYFDKSYELEDRLKDTPKQNLLSDIQQIIKKCTFSYTRQIEQKGLGHAIYTGKTIIGDNPFAVVLPDDLCDNDGLSVLSQMVEIYEKYPNHCIVAIEEVDKNQTEKYGIISGKNIQDNLIKVEDMVEKPLPKDAPSNLAIIGRYILTSEIFEILEDTKAGKSGEIQITDALLHLAKQGKVLAYKFDGVRFDCGSVDGFVKATNYFYKKGNS